MIEIKNLTKTYVTVYPPQSTVAVEDVSLKFHRGEIIGLFGENACRRYTGLTYADSGADTCYESGKNRTDTCQYLTIGTDGYEKIIKTHFVDPPF